MKKRLLALLLVLLLAVGLLAGCGNSGDDDDGGNEAVSNGERDSITVFQRGDWIGTDMYQVDSWDTSQQLLADPFFLTDPDSGEMIPHLMSGYRYSDDGFAFIMTLPEGLQYANGVEVTPEDVVASLEHGRLYSEYAYGYDGVIDFEIDGQDIICHLSGYRSDMEHFFTQPFVGVISKQQLDTMTPEELLWGAIPYGPYYMVDYVPGSHVDLAVNPYYQTQNPTVQNKGVPYIENVTVKFEGDDFTVRQELLNGGIDVVIQMTMESYQEFDGTEDINALLIVDSTIGYVEVNPDYAPFSDIRVRQAIIHAIDREDIEEMNWGGVQPSYALITPAMKNYSKAAEDYYKENYGYDPEKSLELLEAAGYTMGSDGYMEKDGQKLSFTFKARDTGESAVAAQALQIQLKEIGIQLDIETMNWSYVNEAVVSGDFEMGFLQLGWSEPILLLNRFTRAPSTNLDADNYYALVEDITTTIDYDERTDKVGEAQIKLFDYCTVIPLYSPVSYHVYSSGVENVIINKKSDFFLNDAKFI